MRESTPQTFAWCDHCSGDVLHAVSLQGVGLFCSRDCATKASLQHARLLMRRRA